MPEFITAYGPKRKVVAGPYPKSLTKQSFAKEANVNFIVERYQKTGAAEHLEVYKGSYMDVVGEVDYHSALNQVSLAREMFESLPSAVRNRFDNDPGAFLDFAMDEANLPEMREMGLAYPEPDVNPKPEPTSPDVPEVPSGAAGDAP